MDRSEPGPADQRPAVTRALADRCASLGAGQLPADVVTRAKHSVLDWIGVALAGCSDPLVGALVGVADREGGTPVATLLGSGRRASPSQAALVNGAASHALDFDDVHLRSRVHPSAPVLPAVFALAEREGASGRAAILAFVAGVEMQSSLGALLGDAHYRKGWHNTATLGAFGAAAACGSLLGLPTGTLQVALGIVATEAAGLRAVFGTMCKPLQTGRAAANGIAAAELARAGLTSRSDILECAEGFADVMGGDGWTGGDAGGGASRWSTAITRAAAPDAFHTRSIILKYHASCYGTHAPIESALRLREALGDAVPVAIEVAVEPQYMSVCNIATPRDALEAKFSLRHTVALALLGRAMTDEAAFAAATLKDPAVVALRERTTVTPDRDLPRACARVTLRMADGRALSETTDTGRPEADLERQGRRVEAKFRALAEPLLGRGTADEVIDACRGLDGLGDVSALTALFARQRDHR